MELFEGCHPADGVDEIGERSTLFAQSTDGRTDRVFACCATRDIGICAVKCKEGLVKFADQVSILPEEEAALFHIFFGFFDLALGKEFVSFDAGGVHFGAVIEWGCVSESAGGAIRYIGLK